VIAVDTNILIYAHRPDAPQNKVAAQSVRSLAEGKQPWAIPWPCVHEFLSVVTNSKIMKPATPMQTAIDQVEAWMESDRLVLLSEQSGHWQELKAQITSGRIVAAQTHDARIAALCLQHGVSELWTADRDFSRFPELKTRNPLVG
jgi:uncharacterized protein